MFGLLQMHFNIKTVEAALSTVGQILSFMFSVFVNLFWHLKRSGCGNDDNSKELKSDHILNIQV